MKQIQTTLKFLTAIALLAFAVGCASNDLQKKENLAVAAGFKVITPKTADSAGPPRAVAGGQGHAGPLQG